MNNTPTNTVPFALVDKSPQDYTEVFIFSEIDELTCYTIINRLENVSKDTPLKIHISSEGGDVISGFKIAEYLKTFNYTEAYIEGVCFSIATLIALSTNKVYMTKNSFFLIHNPFTEISGDANKMEATIETLRNIENNLIHCYIEKTNLDVDYIKNIMNKEEWMSSSRAMELGFIDEIIEDRYNIYNYKNILNKFGDNVPRTFINKYKDAYKINKGETIMKDHNIENKEEQEIKNEVEEKVEDKIEDKIEDVVEAKKGDEEKVEDIKNEKDDEDGPYKKMDSILSEIRDLLKDLKKDKVENKVEDKIENKKDELEITYTNKTVKVGNKYKLNYPSMR